MASFLDSILGAAGGSVGGALGSAAVGMALGGSSGGSGNGMRGDSGMTRYQFRDYAMLNLPRMSAYAQMALMSGVDPGSVYWSLTNPDVGMSQAQALAAMGLPADTKVTLTGSGWQTMPVLDIPAGWSPGGKVYSTPQEQAIINSGYAKSASTIQATAKAKAAELIAGGMDPMAAKAAAESWASEQAMKSRLSGSADLTSRSLDEKWNRLGQVFTAGSGGIPQGTNNTALAASQLAEGQSNSLSEALAGLAAAYGNVVGSKATSGSGLRASGSWAPAGNFDNYATYFGGTKQPTGNTVSAFAKYAQYFN